jgi:peptidoglycan hydrolase-like protein with peptidoglycan-binding domain
MIVKFVKMAYGEAGPRITKVQKLLAKSGSSIKPTGVFSIGMVSAVKAFQKKHKLPVTGVVDAKTMNKLAEYDKPTKKTTTRKPATSRK